MSNKHALPHRFLRPAILGATYLGGQVAALFANADIRVRVYDLPDKEDPNALAKQAINDLLWQKPLPYAGQEANSLIDPRNYRDDWTLLKDHDLIIDCHTGNLTTRKGLLARLSPSFSKDVALISLTDGLPLHDLSMALPAGLRPRFLGAHFYRPTRFMRLAEIFPTLRTEERVFNQVDEFLQNVLGREVLRIADTPNYVGNRLLVFLIHASFYHARRLGLNLEALEYLTTYPELAENKGIVSRIHFLGEARVNTLHARTTLADKQRFGQLLEQSPNLIDYFEELGQLKPAQKPQTLQRVSASSVVFDLRLQEALDNNDWLALKRINTPSAQFLYSFWRDVWQYMMWVSEESGLDGHALDKALRYGISWPYRFYDMLLDFKPKRVLQATLADKEQHLVSYPVSEHWQRKPRQTAKESKAANPFVSQSTVLEQTDHSTSWVHEKQLIVWQPQAEAAEFDVALMRDLMATAEIAKRKRAILLIYHHGESFGRPKNWLNYYASQSEQLFAEQATLQELILTLRMLPSPILASLSGKIYDSGFAVMMQADRVICDADVSWQLSAVGQGLTSFGGIWFEWLRRIPAIDDYARTAQIFSILNKMITLGSVSDVHTARQLGLLRGNDLFTLTRPMLEERTLAVANLWTHNLDGKSMRYGQKGLSEQQYQYLAAQSMSTREPKHYLALLDLLHQQVADRALSLRIFLQDEVRLFNHLCETHHELSNY